MSKSFEKRVQKQWERRQRLNRQGQFFISSEMAKMAKMMDHAIGVILACPNFGWGEGGGLLNKKSKNNS